MSAFTPNPAPKLRMTWLMLPDNFDLPDDPVEDSSQPLIAAALRQPITALRESGSRLRL